MPRKFPRQFCKVCERPVAECGPVSTRGKCQDCARERIAANHTSLRLRSGDYFYYWRQRTAASVGGVLLDDVRRGE